VQGNFVPSLVLLNLDIKIISFLFHAPFVKNNLENIMLLTV
jgi:hypothetical protein